MDNKEIAVELTKILTNTINATCSANETEMNNAITVVSYYEKILSLLNKHDKDNLK